MDLSNFVGKILPHEKKEEENYLALEVGGEKIKVAIWRQKEGETKILGMGESRFSGGWDGTIKAADEAILQAEKDLSEEVKLKKVIFGLPDHFVENDQIKEPYLSDLKKLTSKLSLNPAGFVVISEAIANFLQKKEGVPQTLILVKIAQAEITVSIFRAGKNTGTEVIPRTDKITLDLESALKKFTHVEVLPSKIFIYDENGHLEKIKRELMEFPWQKRAPFLHIPKIEILEEEESIKAITSAGAGELAKKGVKLEEERVREKEEEEIKFQKAEKLGFVKGKDVLEEGEPLPSKPSLEREEKIEEEEKKEEKPQPRLRLPLFKLPSLSFPELRLREYSKGLIFAVISFLIVIALGALSFFFFFHKAKIFILVDPKILEEQEELKLSTSIVAPDVETKLIPAKTVEVDIAGEKKTEATGRKKTGEKAKGEVTIYNKTSNAKTFKKGTTLVAPNKLKFLLNEEITVPQATESVEALTFGKKKAKVVAESIGPEGNLKEGQEFQIENFPLSSYSAVNENAFSGGTSREIVVVSEQDQKRLEASLSAELEMKAKDSLLSQLEGKEKILEESIKGTISQKKFDGQVGEEEQDLTLALTMHFKATSYKREDLNKLVYELVKENVPEGFEFSDEGVKTKVSEARFNEDGSITFKANFKVNLLPKLDETRLKKDLSGKSLAQAEEYLRNLGNVVGYETKFLSSLPLFKDRLPFLRSNIEIEITPR